VLHEKIVNARLDFLHKISNKLVNSHSLIALEKLNSKEMSKRINGTASKKTYNRCRMEQIYEYALLQSGGSWLQSCIRRSKEHHTRVQQLS
jgi:transposase